MSISSPTNPSIEDLQVATTPRLRIRRFADSDAPFYLALLNDPGFKANIADRGLHSVEAALDSMRERLYRSYAENGFGLYLAERREDGIPVGMAGLVKRDFLEYVDLGYAFLPIGRGQGLATEASAAMLTHARDDFGLERLAAITAPMNQSSIRVLERLGFRSAGSKTFPDDGELCAYFEISLQPDS